MGIMDMIEQAAGMGGNEKTQVAGGVMDEIQSQPGGVGSIFSAFQNNGLGGLVQQWAGGQTAPASPDQVEQGLGGTGMIDSIANRIGMSPTMVKMALAVILPMLIHHYVSNGHVTPQGEPTGAPAPEQGGVLQSILSPHSLNVFRSMAPFTRSVDGAFYCPDGVGDAAAGAGTAGATTRIASRGKVKLPPASSMTFTWQM